MLYESYRLYNLVRVVSANLDFEVAVNYGDTEMLFNFLCVYVSRTKNFGYDFDVVAKNTYFTFYSILLVLFYFDFLPCTDILYHTDVTGQRQNTVLHRVREILA